MTRSRGRVASSSEDNCAAQRSRRGNNVAKGADAERRFSNLPAAAAVLVCGRRGVLQVLALGNGQVVDHLARGGAKAPRAKVSSTSGRGRVALGSR